MLRTRNSLLLAALVLPALSFSATYRCQSTGTGAANWSNPAAWTSCNSTYPHNNGGDIYTADIVTARNFTLDVSITLGESGAVDAAGAGTLSASSSQTVVGTGTSFTTSFIPGDVFTTSTGIGYTWTVQSIADDTHLTVYPVVTLSSATYTIRRHALWIQSTTATIVSASGVTLTLKGDANLASSLTMADGTTLSLSGAAYRVYAGSGEMTQPGSLVINGTSASRATVTSDSGGYLFGKATNSLQAHYVDFSGLGSASTAAVIFNPAAGNTFSIDHSTFTNCGQVATTPGGSMALGASFVFTNNRLVSLPAGVPTLYTFMNIASTAGAPTGSRSITNNALEIPTHDVMYTTQVSGTGFTVKENVLDVMGMSGAAAGPIANFSDNLFVVRNSDSSANWSFVGQGGDTLRNLYFLNDEGPGQLNEHQLMSLDVPSLAGTFTLTNYIFERSGDALYDITHAGSPASVTVTYAWKNILALPTSVGLGSGRLRLRGNANDIIQISHVTGLGDGHDPGSGNSGGLLSAGSQYGGYANMITALRDNLVWHNSVWSGAGTMGFLGSYTTAYTTADLLAAGAVNNNALYNATTGNLYDQAGANPTAALGYNLFRQTTKPTLATDINLGTGSDVRRQGPRFADPTRNIATFDTAYLHNTAPAWVTAHSYSVGDIVSASDPSFYGGATINFRCVTAHTSSAGDATNGQPGGSTTTSYRTNWEFASVARIRDAVVAGSRINDNAIGCVNCTYITALSNWVRRGFIPQNPRLWCAGTDGETIGAVPYCAAGRAYVGAVQ